MYNNFLQQTIFDNSVVNIVWFFVILLSGIILKRFVSHQLSGLIYRFIKRYTEGVDVNAFRELLRKPVGVFIVLISFYLACKQLHYPAQWELPTEEKFGIRFIIWKIFLLSVFFSFTWIVLRLVDFFALVLSYRAKKTESKVDDQLIPFIKESIKFIVMSLSFFLMLGAIFHVNVASLIAGLGIGGLAFALAAKDTLENLLGSFAIFLDKPFTLGDVVKVGNVQGRVEKIGFRSTLIRTFEKTLISMPNKKMIDAELENVSMRRMIRALFPVYMKMDTAPEKIERFMEEGMQLIKSHNDIKDDPSSYIRFDKITDTGIEVQVLFFVDTMDADYYQQVRQEILFGLLKIANKNQIRLDVKSGDVVIQKI